MTTATATAQTKGAGKRPAAQAEQPAHPQQPAARVPDRKIQPIEEARIKSGDFVRAFYVATAFDNTRPEDLLRPEYWAHFAQKLKLRDRIEVWANDASWVAEVVVLGATKNAADVRLLRVDYIDPYQPEGATSDHLKSYDVRYRGLHSQWSVVRLADNALVHEGEGSKAAADKWLSEHLKAMK